MASLNGHLTVVCADQTELDIKLGDLQANPQITNIVVSQATFTIDFDINVSNT
jgi:hypothetical protein